MKQPLFWQRFLTDWVLCGTAVTGSLYCFVTAFELEAPGLLLPFILLFSGLLAFLFRLRRGRLWLGLSAGVILLAVFLYRSTVAASFLWLGRLLLWNFSQGYPWISAGYAVEGLSADLVKPGLLVLAAVQVWLSCWSLVRLRRVIVDLLGAIPCVLVSFLLLDTPPAAWALLLLTGSLALQLLTQSTRRREPRESGTLTCLLFLPLVLLVLGLYALQPPEGYTRSNLISKISDYFSEITGSGDWSLRLGSSPRISQHIDLTDLGARRETQTKVMTVVAPESGLLYLRGAAYAGFDGKSWSLDTSTPWDSAVLTMSGSGEQHSLEITTSNPLDVIYMPYYASDVSMGTAVSDAYLENSDKLTEYTQWYTQGGIALAFSPDPALEESYRQWVYGHCLDLPEQTRQALQIWYAAYAASNTGPLEIAAAVEHCASYSLTPDSPPADEDFTIWFLTQAESGYCVHFASSATALLRAMGYPARLVSGYMVEVQAGKPVTVTEAQAHAWTEYYVDGFGWVPLDATPVSTGDALTQTTEPAPQESTEPAGPAATVTKPSLGTKPGSAPEKEKEASGPRRLPWGWYVPIALAVLVFALVLRRWLSSLLRRRRMLKGSSTGCAGACWRYYRRLCACLGKPPEPKLQALAEKACFSREGLSREELQQLRQGVQRKAAELNRCPGFWRRLYYRYLLAVV